MKGLLMKDLQLLFSNKTTFPVFIIIAAMLMFTGDEETVYFVIAYFTMLCGMMTLSTVSYDELDHSGAFLMTMPITRKLYVVEKYVFTILGIAAGWAIAFVAGCIFSQMKGYEINSISILTGSLATVMVLYVLLSIMIPIQLKYGNEKSRIVLVVMGAIIMLIGFCGKSILAAFNVDAEAVMLRFNTFFANTSMGVLVGLGILMVIVVTLITASISMGIMEKKQY